MRASSKALAWAALVCFVTAGAQQATANNYKEAVLSLSPDHYYQLDETDLGEVLADGDGVPVPATGGGGVQYQGDVIDSGVGPNAPIHGFHEGNFAPLAVDVPVGDVGVHGPHEPGFNATNRAFEANNSASVNLGPGESFGDPTMSVALWFKVPCPAGPEGECQGPPGSDGGDRLFTNNSPDRLDHLQVVFGWGANLVVSIDPNANSIENARQVPHDVLNVKNGEWHHLVATRDGDSFEDVTVVVDGVNYTDQFVDSTDSWGITGSDAHIASRPGGAGGGSQQNMNGAMDDVAIWLGRALTVEEAQELYQAALEIAFLVGPFIRGDCNGDGSVDLSDGVAVLNFAFLGSNAPPCLAACDFNSDGSLDVTNAVFLFNTLFLTGAALPPPTAEEPGTSDKLSDAALGCETPLEL